MATVRVQPEPFDLNQEFARLTRDRTDIGGIGCFVGVVRGTAAGDTLAAMTLEQYPGMTEKALASIASTAETRWNLLSCTVIHRVGRLLPGDPIVLVLTAAAHREAALEATSFLIDWLKTRAPFWKQEERASGERYWVEPRAIDDEAASRWEIGSNPRL